MARMVKVRRTGSTPEGAPKGRWRLRLYTAGQNWRSVTALANLKRICAERLAGNCEVEVVDLLQHPDLAKQDEIVAIPTLVRAGPGTARRVLGDLSDVDRVLSGLGLLPL